MDENMMDKVYVFDFGDLVKVGFSTDEKRRLSELEHSSGKKAIRTYSVNGSRRIEKLTHFYLDDYRTTGEFFTCDFDTAKNAVDGIISGKIELPKNALTKAQSRASTKYNKSRDNIMLRPTKEEGQAIREASARSGLSVQQYVLEAVREKMQKDTPNH